MIRLSFSIGILFLINLPIPAQSEAVEPSLLLSSSDKDDCTLSLLIPFHHTNNGVDGANDPSQNEEDVLSLLATTVLAVEDWNNNHNHNNPNQWTWQNNNNNDTFSKCMQKQQFSNIQLIDTRQSRDHVLEQQDQWSNSCAVVGIENYQVANALIAAAATNDKNIPIISHGAWLPTTGKEQSTTTHGDHYILATASWKERMNVLTAYLERIGRRRTALLYDPSAGDDEENDSMTITTISESSSSLSLPRISPFSSPPPPPPIFNDFQKATDGTLITVFDTPIVLPTEKEDLELVLRRLRSRFVYTFVVAWEGPNNNGDIELLAQVAKSLNMLSDEFLWVLLDSFVSPQHLNQYDGGNNDSAVRQEFFARSLIFQAVDPFVSGVEDPYGDDVILLDEKRPNVFNEIQNRPKLIDTINEILLKNNETSHLWIDDEFFDNNNGRHPAYGAGFLYDSVIAAGFATCHLANNNNNDVEYGFDQLDFEGITGRFQISNGVRKSGTVEFGIYSIEQEYTNAEVSGYIAVLKDMTVNGQWVTEEPIDEQRLLEYAYILGFTLAGIAFVFCLGAAIFIFRNRENQIVAVGQPLFLYFVCFGSSFFSLSIIFQSFDDYTVESESLLNTMCMLQVWMAYGGQIIVYMALFTKLWRIKKLGRMKKKMILPRHVIWPFLLFMFVSFGILVAWTIAQPSTFYRVEVGVEDDFVDPTSYPICTYEVGFQTASQVPLFISMGVLWYMTYKTRGLPKQVTDSRRIARVLLSHVLITIFGILLIAVALAISSFNFAYLIRVLTNFFYAICTVGLLVIPRFLDIQREKRGLETKTTTVGSVRVSGLEMDDSVSSIPNSSSSGNLSGLSNNTSKTDAGKLGRANSIKTSTSLPTIAESNKDSN